MKTGTRIIIQTYARRKAGPARTGSDPMNQVIGQGYSHKRKGKQQKDNVQKFLKALDQRALLDVQKLNVHNQIPESAS